MAEITCPPPSVRIARMALGGGGRANALRVPIRTRCRSGRLAVTEGLVHRGTARSELQGERHLVARPKAAPLRCPSDVRQEVGQRDGLNAVLAGEVMQLLHLLLDRVGGLAFVEGDFRGIGDVANHEVIGRHGEVCADLVAIVVDFDINGEPFAPATRSRNASRSLRPSPSRSILPTMAIVSRRPGPHSSM